MPGSYNEYHLRPDLPSSNVAIFPHCFPQLSVPVSPSLTVEPKGEKEPKDRSGRSTWFNRQWGSNIYCTSPLVPLMVSTISYSTCLNLWFFSTTQRLTIGLRGRVRPFVIQGEIYDSTPKAKNEHRRKKIRHQLPALPVCGKQQIGDAQKAGKFVGHGKTVGCSQRLDQPFWSFLGEVPQTQRWRAKGRAEEKSSAKTP